MMIFPYVLVAVFLYSIPNTGYRFFWGGDLD